MNAARRDPDRTYLVLAEALRGAVDATALREAASRLDAFCDAESVRDRADGFVRLVRALRVLMEGAPAAPPLAAALCASPEVQSRTHDALRALLAETDATALFGDTGIPAERGFFAELGDRVSSRLLPAPPDDRDISRLVRRLFREKADVDRLKERDMRFFHEIAEFLVDAGAEAWEPMRRSFADGFRLLAGRVQAHGLSREIRARGSRVRVPESPFFQVVRSADAFVDAWLSGGDVTAAAGPFRRDSADCRKEIRVVRENLERAGVSVQVVFGLEVMDRCLTRMALMADVVVTPRGFDRSKAIHRLVVRLAHLSQQDRSLRHLVRWNLHLLDRKIVERSGQAGEHYVASSPAEYRHIWLAAAGGGALTVLTAAVKMAIHHLDLAAFPEGFLYGLNFAGSFLLMQAFGLILATKQPAMTAAALARIISSSEGEARLENVATFFARLTRSQLAAAVANVLAVGVGAALFDRLWRLAARHPYLDATEALHTFETLSPVNSGTVFFAALTGVLLWMGAVAGGWFENWATCHRLAEGIAQSRARNAAGQERRRRFAALFSRNAAGWATNISLGFLLGFAPTVGRFFGIPFDVRHVTLSTGTLALAAAGRGREWFGGGFFLLATAGIGVMFVLNLGVSFALSLVNAARAYDMTNEDLLGVLRHVRGVFLRTPLSFFVPPKTGAAPSAS